MDQDRHPFTIVVYRGRSPPGVMLFGKIHRPPSRVDVTPSVGQPVGNLHRGVPQCTAQGRLQICLRRGTTEFDDELSDGRPVKTLPEQP